jgi:hypothetical protein
MTIIGIGEALITYGPGLYSGRRLDDALLSAVGRNQHITWPSYTAEAFVDSGSDTTCQDAKMNILILASCCVGRVSRF